MRRLYRGYAEAMQRLCGGYAEAMRRLYKGYIGYTGILRGIGAILGIEAI
jgi:hypothetical protein